MENGGFLGKMVVKWWFLGKHGGFLGKNGGFIWFHGMDTTNYKW